MPPKRIQPQQVRLRVLIVSRWYQTTEKAEGRRFEPPTHFWAPDFESPAEAKSAPKTPRADNDLSRPHVVSCQVASESPPTEIDRKRDEIRAQLDALPHALIEIMHSQLRLLLDRD